MIDVLMPAHPKDLGTLEFSIDSIRKYVKDVRRVIVISNRRLTDKAEWFNLDNFPFSGEDVKNIHGIHPKNGWFLMQLIKLYAPICIPDVSENSLSCDTDTIFFNSVSFLKSDFPVWTASYDQQKGNIQNPLNAGRFMQKLHPEIYTDNLISQIKSNRYNIEPISHQMIFKKSVLESLFKDVEDYHQDTDFWKIFLKSSDGKKSGASEHQLYFLYCLLKYPNLFKYSHNFKWKIASNGHGSETVNLIPNQDTFNDCKKMGWDWIAFQSHMRGIRVNTYKNLCLICGKEKNNCSVSGCNNIDARERELRNL